jgi:predicted regulator of Ras-like GTPase activity (Roadblock/LC7/MglB family)
MMALSTDFVMFEEESQHLREAVRSLRQEANAKVVFLVDRNGQQLASTGELEGIDSTSLASLTAGNVAATDGLAQLLGEKEFSVVFHEGERDSLHISVIGRMILVVIFDERSSLGLVRLRVRKVHEVLTEILKTIEEKAAQQGTAAGGFDSPFAEITDDDIDALFSD